MIRKTKIENISRILRRLWESKQSSRVQIARDLELNKSTVTDIVSFLIKEGLIIEKEEGFSSPLGGRKPVTLELDTKYGYILGIEITSENYTVSAVDLAGEILFSETIEEQFNPSNFHDKTINILTRYPEQLKWIGAPILAAGIGMSGIIDSKQGIIIGSIALDIIEPFHFHANIATQFSFPIFIENDANCCAWGELTFNRSENLQNFIFTLVEFHKNISVGFGIVIDGKVYYGNSNSAGEFHSLFCPEGDRRQFKSAPLDLKAFIEELSRHLALFTNTFNLGQIFLGGDIEQYQNITKPILEKSINDNWMYTSPVQCEIRFSSLDKNSVAYGAAGMALEQIFREPKNILI